MVETNRLLIELYRSARESPIPEFQERTLRLLKSLCRFNSAMWGTGELSGRGSAIFHAIDLHNLPADLLISYAQIADRDPIAEELWRHTGRIITCYTHDLTRGRQNAAVSSFDRHYELNNLLGGTVTSTERRAVGFLGLWRAKDSDHFTEDERRAGESLVPHVLEAGLMNRSMWLSRLTDTAVAGRGVRAIADRSGILCAEDPAFPALLRQEWSDWQPPLLPAPLRNALERASKLRFVGKRISVNGTYDDGMLFLVAREKVSLHGFTPAQLAVAKLIASGHSYKQAAAALSLSAATVRNHIHAAYAKAGVHNKAALAHWLSHRR